MPRVALVSVRETMERFALAMVFTLAAVGGTGVALASRIAHDESLDDAAYGATRMATALAGTTVYADERHPGYAAGLRELDRLAKRMIAERLVLRVKVWSADGTVIYSDEPRQVGRRFTLAPEDRHLFETGGAHAELTDLDASENRFDRGLGMRDEVIVEVYAAFETLDGERLLFEGYLPAESLMHHRQDLLVTLLPAMALGPLLMVIALLPIVLGLVRNLHDADEQRMRWVRDMFRARREERRRVARELHDQVLPELAGVRLSLDLAAQELDTRGSLPPSVLRSAGAEMSEQMGNIRALLSELRTPAVERLGLSGALRDLGEPLVESGVDLTVAVVAEDLGEEEVQTVYATVREGLRNAQRHAQAQRVLVQVTTDADELVVVVSDDGCGPPPEAQAGLRSDHGLGLLADIVAEIGGVLSLRPVPEGGATLELRLPRRRPVLEQPVSDDRTCDQGRERQEATLPS